VQSECNFIKELKDIDKAKAMYCRVDDSGECIGLKLKLKRIYSQMESTSQIEKSKGAFDIVGKSESHVYVPLELRESLWPECTITATKL
jgi:hypothetical protein